MFGRRGPYGACCTGRLMQWRVWVQSVVFESQTVARCIFLHNHGFVSYPLPACRSVRKKPHHIQSACCRHHLPAELYQIFRKSISRLSLTLAACPSCCLLERAVSAPLHERREQAQLGGEQEEVSEVSGLALFSHSPHFSYPSAAWWNSPALPCGASVRAAACRPAQTAGSGESLAACVGSGASPRPPLVPAWLNRAVTPGWLCHQMSPWDSVAAPQALCSAWLWKGREMPLPAVPGLVPCPRGELKELGELGRWCRAGGCPALGQPPAWTGW